MSVYRLLLCNLIDLWLTGRVWAGGPAMKINSSDLPLDQARGQCYDGCVTMTVSKNGVATILLTHCYCHALNLVVGDTVKVSL